VVEAKHYPEAPDIGSRKLSVAEETAQLPSSTARIAGQSDRAPLPQDCASITGIGGTAIRLANGRREFAGHGLVSPASPKDGPNRSVSAPVLLWATRLFC
jgi:hypothetical protein